MEFAFCSEFLDYQGLLKPEVIRLIKQYDLKVCLAIDKKRLKKALPLLKRFQKEGIEFILWPLLPLEGDYWPSERNIRQFSLLLDEIISDFKKEKIRIKEIAVDLEPPRTQYRSLNHPFRTVRERIKKNMNIGRYRQAIKKLNELIEKLHTYRIKVTVTCSSDFTLEDLWLFGGNAGQDLQESPLFKVNWDEINFQIYNSAIQGCIKVLSLKTLTRALYELLSRAKRKSKTKISVALGTIDPEDKTEWANFRSPEAIALDIQAALALDIERILFYSLDGLLKFERPNEVLDKLFAQKPKVPPLTLGSIAYRTTRILLRGLLELISISRLVKK